MQQRHNPKITHLELIVRFSSEM